MNVKQALFLKESRLLHKNIWKQYSMFLKIAQSLLQRLIFFPAQNWLESHTVDSLERAPRAQHELFSYSLRNQFWGIIFLYKPIMSESPNLKSMVEVIRTIITSTWLKSQLLTYAIKPCINSRWFHNNPCSFLYFPFPPQTLLANQVTVFNFPEHPLLFSINGCLPRVSVDTVTHQHSLFHCIV